MATDIDRVLASRIVVRFKSSTAARLRLLCLPYAGGSAVAFHPWGACLPDDVELWSAQYRGRGYRLREMPYCHMNDVLDELEVAMAPLLDVPTVIFGHSMGAVLAFELTRRLAARATLPVHLFLSGCQAPLDDALHPTTPPGWSDEQLIKRLHSLAGTPMQVLAHPELRQAALSTLRADLSCLHGWRVCLEPPLPVPIMVFGGMGDPHVPTSSLDGWARGSSRAFGKRLFRGDHFFIREAYPEMISWMLRTACS